MRVGFTGSREGMTTSQLATVRAVLADIIDVSELHHGDCIGADKQAHEVAEWLELWTVGHIPDDESRRAFCRCDETRAPLPYMARNRNIVHETETLLAAPKGEHVIRSGTWSTVRWARRAGRRIYIARPDGTLHFIPSQARF